MGRGEVDSLSLLPSICCYETPQFGVPTYGAGVVCNTRHRDCVGGLPILMDKAEAFFLKRAILMRKQEQPRKDERSRTLPHPTCTQPPDHEREGKTCPVMRQGIGVQPHPRRPATEQAAKGNKAAQQGKQDEQCFSWHASCLSVLISRFVLLLKISLTSCLQHSSKSLPALQDIFSPESPIIRKFKSHQGQPLCFFFAIDSFLAF